VEGFPETLAVLLGTELESGGFRWEDGTHQSGSDEGGEKGVKQPREHRCKTRVKCWGHVKPHDIIALHSALARPDSEPAEHDICLTAAYFPKLLHQWLV
jgi:hypothetical protein